MQSLQEYVMRKIYFIMILNLSTYNIVVVSNAVGKCCPSGQVFSVKENFTCAYSYEDRQVYHIKNHSNYEGFGGCEDSKNFTITSLGDAMAAVALDDAILGPACIDLLWDENISQSIPIVFQCHRQQEQNEKKNYGIFPTTPITFGSGDGGGRGGSGSGATATATATATASSPILITSLRICCPRNTLFDVYKRDCVYKKDYEDNDVLNYFKFLYRNSDFVTVVRGAPKCNHASLDYVVNFTKDLRVLDDGRFEVMLPEQRQRLRGYDDGGGAGSITILANEDNSCVDPGTGHFDAPDFLVLRICTGSKYCKKNTCVRKCCPEDEGLFGDGSCKELPIQAPPGRFHDALLNASISRGSAASVEFIDTIDYGLLIGKPCKYGMFPVEPDEKWHLTRHGRFFLPSYRTYDNDEYCMDMFYDESQHYNKLYPFVCFDDTTQLNDESPIRYGIFAILELTSCTFLLLTLLVYICLPVLRNLHGKTLMCHVASLIVAYATLATVALATPLNPANPKEHRGETNLCVFLGFTLLLSWIAAFSWLNVMCFDIWWTFGGIGGVGISGHRGGGRAYKKRFFMYSLYAWGFSLFVTIIGIIADHTDILPLYLRPNVGSDSCWFERNVNYYGEIIFFVGPVSIQLIANVIFFILTAMYCSKVKAEITRVMAPSSDPRSRRFRADKTKLIMNVKLFIVMGVSWSLEVISSYLNHYATSLAWRNEFFYFSDFFNCLQGLLIFILFVLKSKVYNALRRRFGGRERNSSSSREQQQQQQQRQRQNTGLHDPYKMRNSASSSTIMSTFGVSCSSP